MQRLVIWGFALALVPLSIAVLSEAVIVIRSFFAQAGRKESVSATPSRES